MTDRFKGSKKWGSLLVVLFILVFLWGRNADAAELGLGLGFGVNHTENATIQELSIQSDDYRWFASYTRVGGGKANGLVLDYNNRFVGAYRVFWRRDKDWKPYLSLGAAYFEEAPLNVISERLTYDMRFGARWKDILELEAAHNSTAGRSLRNSGFDTLNLRVVFQF